MSQLIVLETLHAVPGKTVALKQALLEIALPSRKEPGCISYEIAESESGDDILLVLMRWVNMAGLKAHDQSEHVLEFVKKYNNVLYGEVTESHYLSC